MRNNNPYVVFKRNLDASEDYFCMFKVQYYRRLRLLSLLSAANEYEFCDLMEAQATVNYRSNYFN